VSPEFLKSWYLWLLAPLLASIFSSTSCATYNLWSSSNCQKYKVIETPGTVLQVYHLKDVPYEKVARNNYVLHYELNTPETEDTLGKYGVARGISFVIPLEDERAFLEIMNSIDATAAPGYSFRVRLSSDVVERWLGRDPHRAYFVELYRHGSRCWPPEKAGPLWKWGVGPLQEWGMDYLFFTIPDADKGKFGGVTVISKKTMDPGVTISLIFEQTESYDGRQGLWWRIPLTPLALAVDIVTLPIQIPTFYVAMQAGTVVK
jgi:hypothetical protein